VPETQAVQKTMQGMISQDGATLLFPTSFGYFDPHMLAIAAKNKDVRFAHCGGLWTKGKHPDNTGSFFGYIDEAQYLNGVIAGHMSKSKKLAFVAAKPIPQVLRNINAYTLGARSVDPKITTSVIFTGDWSMAVKEAEATNSLADQGCDVFTMHVDGPKVVVETAAKRGKMVCGYHASQAKLAPQAYLTGAEWNWVSRLQADHRRRAQRQAAPQLRARRPQGRLRQDQRLRPGRARGRAQERRRGQGQDDGRQLRHLRRRDEGQHRQGRHPQGQGLQADRCRARRHELPGRRRDRQGLKAGAVMNRQPWHDTAEAFLLPILAMAGALLAFGVFVWFGGHDPIQVWTLLFKGAFGDAFSWQNTLHALGAADADGAGRGAAGTRRPDGHRRRRRAGAGRAGGGGAALVLPLPQGLVGQRVLVLLAAAA
jgi:hypothetical protein